MGESTLYRINDDSVGVAKKNKKQKRTTILFPTIYIYNIPRAPYNSSTYILDRPFLYWPVITERERERDGEGRERGKGRGRDYP